MQELQQMCTKYFWNKEATPSKDKEAIINLYTFSVYCALMLMPKTCSQY